MIDHSSILVSFFSSLFIFRVDARLLARAKCFHHEYLDYDHFVSIFSIFPINLLLFSHFQNHKIMFSPSIKGFNLRKEFRSI